MSGDGEFITCAFIPLTDCAILVAAHELGFARQEGVTLALRRETSWSNVRDKLALGLVDAAHMLSPMPIAMSLGLSAMAADISAPILLSVNGNVFGVSRALAQRLREETGAVWGSDAAAVGAALRQVSRPLGRRLRIGSPWRFSMHTLLTRYWLGRCGFDIAGDIEFVVVPPPYMAEVLGAGEIDVFCVGEPWGSSAVARGVADLLLAGPSVWRAAPEKALGVSARLRDDRPEALAALIRALYRAAGWCAEPAHRSALAEILAQDHYVAAPSELIERALSGRFITGAGGDVRTVGGAIEFFGGAATFPWRSQAAWIASQLAWDEPAIEPARAMSVFRPDLYRAALAPLAADLPAASAKIEGSLAQSTEAASTAGVVTLGPDTFFDGSVFDPDAGAASMGATKNLTP